MNKALTQAQIDRLTRKNISVIVNDQQLMLQCEECGCTYTPTKKRFTCPMKDRHTADPTILKFPGS